MEIQLKEDWKRMIRLADIKRMEGGAEDGQILIEIVRWNNLVILTEYLHIVWSEFFAQ